MLRSVQLAGMGPKLLVSDVSTANQPVLRWQLLVRGNTAVEFGVIPADLQVRASTCGTFLARCCLLGVLGPDGQARAALPM